MLLGKVEYFLLNLTEKKKQAELNSAVLKHLVHASVNDSFFHCTCLFPKTKPEDNLLSLPPFPHSRSSLACLRQIICHYVRCETEAFRCANTDLFVVAG